MSVRQQGMPEFISGDKVIHFEKALNVAKFQGYADFPSIQHWLEQNPTENHLGMLHLFGQGSKTTYGIMPELLKKRSVIEVGANRRFTYDIAVYEEQKCETVRDHSDQQYPGIDGSTFKITLSEPFQPGDILTYDPWLGDQIIVSEFGYEMVGEGFEHIVKLVGNDKEAWYPASQLSSGITYTKIGHSIAGELGTNYSAIKLPKSSSKVRCEFQLGNESGVETFLTSKAGGVDLSAGVAKTADFIDNLMAEADRLGDVAMMMDYVVDKNGMPKVNTKSARLAPTLELLTRRELEKITATQLMWQKAGRYKDAAGGDVIMNEGLWRQLRRGKIIKYARPQGLTQAHISDAVEYLFRHNPIHFLEREIMFECGTDMYNNFLDIFRKEVQEQISSVAAFAGGALLGDSMQLPEKMVEGSKNNDLTLNYIQFTGVMLPGIGKVKAKRNIALDSLVHTDRFSQGFHPYGKSHTSYSAIIWDAKDQKYSNNMQVPEGAKIIEGGNIGDSMYLVKPEGSMTYSGYSNGRWSPDRAHEIISVGKQRKTDYWCWSSVALFVPDPSRFVMIELDAAARKGFS